MKPLQEWDGQLEALFAPCVGTYSPRTFKGYTCDLRLFAGWCQTNQCSWLPASPYDVAKFVDVQAEHNRLSTVERRIHAIAFAVADIACAQGYSTFSCRNCLKVSQL
jgi:hypothetical protein